MKKIPEEKVEEITQIFTVNGEFCFEYVDPKDCVQSINQVLNEILQDFEELKKIDNCKAIEDCANLVRFRIEEK